MKQIPLTNNGYDPKRSRIFAFFGALAIFISLALGCGSGSSNGDTPATPTLTRPVFTLAPQSQQVIAGTPASFSVTVTGNPTPTLAWQSSSDGSAWVDITGATQTTYTVASPQATAWYRVIATNSQGSATSNVAKLTIAVPSILAINAGGPLVGSFLADVNFTGGTASTKTSTVDTSTALNAAPAEVYLSERYGAFTYSLPGLTSGAAYLVRLHFAEVYWTATGKRLFDVTINTTKVLSNFDIYAAAGGGFKAFNQDFTAIANVDGKISLQFANGSADKAKISGIEVFPAEAPVPAVPTGLGAVANDFNQVTLNWTDTNNSLAGYNVYRSTTTPFTAIAANRIAPMVLGGRFVDTTVAPNTTYYYLTTAVNAKGESAASNQAQASTPGPHVTGFMATSIESNKLSMAWDTLANATSFQVYRSTTQGFTPALVNQIGSTATTSYEDATVVPDTNYYYRVTALIGGQETTASFELGIRTPVLRFGDISQYLVGQNDWYSLPDAVWPVVKESYVGSVRIGGNGYNGGPMDNVTLLHHVDMIRSAGAEPLIQVPNKVGAYRAAEMVDFINKVSGRNVRLWSIGNEPDLGYTGGENLLSAEVAAFTKERSTVMRDVDPTILIFAGEMAWYSGTKYGNLLGGVDDISGRDAKGRWIIDGITFHTYPFGNPNDYSRQQVLDRIHTGFNGTVNSLMANISTANTKHSRTGTSALKWGLTEFNITFKNPTINGPEGVGVSSFLNGQLFAEFFKTGMIQKACMMNTWSINEGGGAGAGGDLGYLAGSAGNNPTPRSSYYHMQMIGKYLLDGNDSTYLASTSNAVNVSSIATSTITNRVAVMVLNEDETPHTLAVRLNNDAVQAVAEAKIQVSANLAIEYTDSIAAQSTMVLVFDNLGVLKSKITYSLTDCTANLAPTVVNY